MDPTNSSQSDTLQVKSTHSCKTNRLMLYLGFTYRLQNIVRTKQNFYQYRFFLVKKFDLSY